MKGRIFTSVFVFLILLIGGSFDAECQAHQRDFDEKGYHKEVKRFENVLANASDEELFLVLRFAIYNGYVPTMEIDPYYNFGTGVGRWNRTKRIYATLKERNRYDLLAQLYPDKKALDEYVSSRGTWFEAHEQDTTQMDEYQKREYIHGRQLYFIRDAIMQNLAPDSSLLESIGKQPRTALYNKYFGTPFLGLQQIN